MAAGVLSALILTSCGGPSVLIPVGGQTAGTSTTLVDPPPPPTSPGPAVADTLACIRSYEQGAAGYATETGNGHSGAYQFKASTWNGAVTRAGYPEWAGRRASEAPPDVQDAAAAQLLSERGLQPWPTPSRRCARG